MQTTSPLRNGQIFMKDAQCAETDEQSVFQFLFFEIWLILFSIFKCFYRPNMVKINCLKRCAMFWNRFLCSWVFFFCTTFSFWDIIEFVFDNHSELVWDLEIFAILIQTLSSEAESSIRKHTGSRNTVGGMEGETPHQKNFFFSQMDKCFWKKNSNMIIHKWIMRNELKLMKNQVFLFLQFLVFEIWSFLYSKLVNLSINFEYKIGHNWKNRNSKTEFSFVSAHCASFL